ncbi:MAG TPA: tetrahydrofolate dehydrogenase/cyclohydrolase catalytic domain-containing protein [Clostridia bacterium]|nr:tetrahydrofolate dehydrogenase/cyclohydrolase catalytic domain-containing protein [Clostridia bacterium]
MVKILDGKQVAQALTQQVREDVAALAERNIYPRLGIVRVGERPDDISYERGALKRCEMAGIEAIQYLLPADATQRTVIDLINRINQEETLHGCLIFRPMTTQISDAAVRAAVSSAKDIDGITDGSLASVFTGASSGFAPCTAAACIAILDYYGIELTGKNVVVVGRSLVIGRPVAMLMMHKNATVTICHTKTANLPDICRSADILIAAAGKAETITADYCRPGQVVIDVGIHVKADGRLCGDVDFAAVSSIVEAITPVPGGVGAVTTSVLVKHTVSAARRQLLNDDLPLKV